MITVAHSNNFFIVTGNGFGSRYEFPQFERSAFFSRNLCVWDAKISVDDRMVFLGDYWGKGVHVVHSSDFALIRVLKTQGKDCVALLLLPSLSKLYTAHGDTTIFSWNVKTLTGLSKIKLMDTKVICLCPVGESFFSSDEGGSLVKWDGAKDARLLSRKCECAVTSLALNAEERLLFAGLINSIEVFDVADLRPVFTYRNIQLRAVHSILLLPDENKILATSSDSCFVEFPIESQPKLYVHEKQVNSLAIISQEFLLTGSDDGTVLAAPVVNNNRLRLVEQIEEMIAELRSLKQSPLSFAEMTDKLHHFLYKHSLRHGRAEEFFKGVLVKGKPSGRSVEWSPDKPVAVTQYHNGLREGRAVLHFPTYSLRTQFHNGYFAPVTSQIQIYGSSALIEGIVPFYSASALEDMKVARWVVGEVSIEPDEKFPMNVANLSCRGKIVFRNGSVCGLISAGKYFVSERNRGSLLEFEGSYFTVAKIYRSGELLTEDSSHFFCDYEAGLIIHKV